jgi:hypothetical protein
MQKTGLFTKVSAWLFNNALCKVGLNTFLSISVFIITCGFKSREYQYELCAIYI